YFGEGLYWLAFSEQARAYCYSSSPCEGHTRSRLEPLMSPAAYPHGRCSAAISNIQGAVLSMVLPRPPSAGSIQQPISSVHRRRSAVTGPSIFASGITTCTPLTLPVRRAGPSRPAVILA